MGRLAGDVLTVLVIPLWLAAFGGAISVCTNALQHQAAKTLHRVLGSGTPSGSWQKAIFKKF